MGKIEQRKKRMVLWVLAVFLLAACGGWFLYHRNLISIAQEKKTVYTCPMHHQIRWDHPGSCPICSMTLMPLEEEEATPPAGSGTGPKAATEKKVKYWTDAMNPGFKSDHPGKAPDGMDLVPIYEEDAEAGGTGNSLPGLSPIRLTAYKQQMIGVRMVAAKVEPLVRTIRTVGRFAGGGGDFASLAGEFAAQNSLSFSRRFVVADIYALDLPFVKVGQKAYVTPLSGSGPRLEGKVTFIFPYDGTQSRVTRVKVALPGSNIREIFANVEIEAAIAPRLAVPPGAVMDTGTRRYVFLENEPGNFIPRQITVGYEGDESWEVLSGLKAGDRVVDGANFLVDADSKIKAAFAQGDKP